MHDEELASVGIGTRIRHGHDATPITTLVQGRVSLNLVGERSSPIAFSASAVATRISALNHEAFDDTVERHSIVVTMLGQQAKILHRFGRILFEELEFDRTPIRFDRSVSSARTLRTGRNLWLSRLCGGATGDEEKEADQNEGGNP